MAIWEFTEYSFKDLIALQEKYEELEKLGQQQDEDMLSELDAEIEKRKEAGPKYAILFTSINNDTYEESEELRGVYDELETMKEIEEIVKNTYDGVWEPVIDTIQVFKLEEEYFPDS